MKPRTPEQQIAALRPGIRFAAHFHRWLLAGAATGAIAAAVFWNPIPLMFSIFLAVVGLSEQRAGPNIVAAIAAYDVCRTPTCGDVTVAITRWDMDDHYHATVSEPGHPDWTYEFVPQGWRPAARTFPAINLAQRDIDQQPVLAIVAEGIMIPRDTPKAGLKNQGKDA